MATTTNYGWAEPDNTSLVRNGAQDIRILGDAIDASVWNIGFGQAGKNKIINGDFGIWQRGTSFNAFAHLYTADRWDTLTDKTAASVLTTQQAFTAGTAPVAGYESQYFLRTVFPSGGTYCIQEQRVENVRTFAGQTVTLSFWAKANATATIDPTLVQSFGSGGSGEVQTTTSSLTLTTSWVRYSVTATLPSISGKTIGAGSYLAVRAMRALTASGFTIDIWGVQLEYGSKATPFQTASGGSIQGELAMCQRYYWRAGFEAATQRLGSGICLSTTNAHIQIPYPVEMRTRPTALEQSGTAGDYSLAISGANVVCSAVPTFANATKNGGTVSFDVASGLTNGQATLFRNVNTTAYFGWSAEL
jgi:hypothetical protein